MKARRWLGYVKARQEQGCLMQEGQEGRQGKMMSDKGKAECKKAKDEGQGLQDLAEGRAKI